MSAACLPARPLRHWDDAVLAHLQLRLGIAWSSWCHDWDVPCGPVTCSNAGSATTSENAAAWYLIGQRSQDEPALWFGGVKPDPAAALHALLFGGVAVQGQRSPVAAAMLTTAWDRLRRQVCQEMGVPLAASAADPLGCPPQAQSWSGAVLATLSAGDEDAVPLFLHLASDLVTTLLPSRGAAPNGRSPSLTALPEALQERVIGLEVAMLGAELDLASIQTLQPGDVVLLQHPLAEPLRLQLQGCAAREPVAFGLLGCRGSSKAITLLAEPRPAAERPAAPSFVPHRMPR